MALADEESTFARAKAKLARAEAELAREALNRAIKDFKNSKEFKEEILEGGFASYCVGYEDSRDTIKKLYPNFDLSSIVPPASKDGAAEKDGVLTQDGAPTAPEVVQVLDATPEQRDGHGD